MRPSARPHRLGAGPRRKYAPSPAPIRRTAPARRKVFLDSIASHSIAGSMKTWRLAFATSSRTKVSATLAAARVSCATVGSRLVIRASMSAACSAAMRATGTSPRSPRCTTSRMAAAVGTMRNVSAVQGSAIARRPAQSRAPCSTSSSAVRAALPSASRINCGVFRAQLSGNAAQDLIGTGVADGNGGPQGKRRQRPPTRQLRGRRDQRGVRCGQDRRPGPLRGACRPRGDPMWLSVSTWA